VRIFLWELATCDWVLSFDYFLWEIRIFKSPETKHALFKCFCTIDIILTISDCDQIWIRNIDINTTDLATLSKVELELEERFYRDLFFRVEFLIIFIFLFFLLFSFFFTILLNSKTKRLLSLILFVLLLLGLFISIAKIYRRIVFVEHMLFMIFTLSQ